MALVSLHTQLTARVVPGLCVATRSVSTSARLRRLKQKSGWKRAAQEDDEVFDLWANRLGDTLEVNWAVAKHGIVAVDGDAYRNLHVRGLAMLAAGRLDSNKAIHVTGSTGGVVGMHVEGTPAPVPTSKPIPADAFKKAQALLNKTLTGSAQIHMMDGRVASRVTRVITDSANTALYLHHMLQRTPLGEPIHFGHDLVAYVCTAPPPGALANLGIPVGPDGVAVLHDLPSATCLVFGNSPAALRDALAVQLAHAEKAKAAAVQGAPPTVLQCDVLAGEEGASAFVFADSGVEFCAHTHPLFNSGGHHLVGDFVESLWRGVEFGAKSAPVGRGDIVEADRVTSSGFVRRPRTGLPALALRITSEGPSRKASVEEMAEVMAQKSIGGTKDSCLALLKNNNVLCVFVAKADASPEGLTSCIHNPGSLPNKTQQAKPSTPPPQKAAQAAQAAPPQAAGGKKAPHGGAPPPPKKGAPPPKRT